MAGRVFEISNPGRAELPPPKGESQFVLFTDVDDHMANHDAQHDAAIGMDTGVHEGNAPLHLPDGAPLNPHR